MDGSTRPRYRNWRVADARQILRPFGHRYGTGAPDDLLIGFGSTRRATSASVYQAVGAKQCVLDQRTHDGPRQQQREHRDQEHHPDHQ